MVMTVSCVVNHACTLGEGPVWDPEKKRLFWVDILEGEVHQYAPVSNKHTILKVGQFVSALAIRSSGGLIAAMESGFAQIELETGLATYLAKTEHDLSNNRFNDGKCDPAGRFWAGSMDQVHGTAGAGNLYMLDTDLSISVKINNVTCSNGMAWSLDHSTFYYIDTPTRRVVAYDYDICTGAIANKRVLIDIPEADGFPDGMTIDRDGFLWIALWGGWKIAKYDPFSGKCIGEINLPVAQVTSCTFAGDALQDLYITTARTGLTQRELSNQPLAGCLFVCETTGSKGLPPTVFA